jgi:hypothetical protein
MSRVRERVHFRLIQMPCCNTLFCWVNPRLPNYCPECGQRVFAKIKADPSVILVSDETGWLNLQEY